MKNEIFVMSGRKTIVNHCLDGFISFTGNVSSENYAVCQTLVFSDDFMTLKLSRVYCAANKLSLEFYIDRIYNNA